MNDVFEWIEKHPVLIGIVQLSITIIIAWCSGVLSYFQRFLKKPKLYLYPGACLGYIESHKEGKGKVVVMILNPSIVNATDRDFDLNRFLLGYECRDLRQTFKQKLLRIPFPCRPRRKIGEGYKELSVFLTHYLDGKDDVLTVSTRIRARSVTSGYVLFVANVFGTWEPTIIENSFKVCLDVTTASEGTLRENVTIKLISSEMLEDFCPGILGHIRSENIGNQCLL